MCIKDLGQPTYVAPEVHVRPYSSTRITTVEEYPPLQILSAGSNDTTTEQSPLLRLPSELRNRIYEFAVDYGVVLLLRACVISGGRTPERLALRKFSEHDRHGLVFDISTQEWQNFTPGREQAATKPGSTFALGCVNRQLARETSAMYYGNNIFELNSLRSLSLFLESIGEQQKHVQYIRIVSDNRCVFPYMLAKSRHYSRIARIRPSRMLRIPLHLRTFSIDHQVLHRVSARTFVAEIRVSLLDWHKAHTDAGGHSGVLDLIKISSRCDDCEEPFDLPPDMDSSLRAHRDCDSWTPHGRCSRCLEDIQCKEVKPTLVMRMLLRYQIVESLGLTAERLTVEVPETRLMRQGIALPEEGTSGALFTEP